MGKQKNYEISEVVDQSPTVSEPCHSLGRPTFAEEAADARFSDEEADCVCITTASEKTIKGSMAQKDGSRRQRRQYRYVDHWRPPLLDYKYDNDEEWEGAKASRREVYLRPFHCRGSKSALRLHLLGQSGRSVDRPGSAPSNSNSTAARRTRARPRTAFPTTLAQRRFGPPYTVLLHPNNIQVKFPSRPNKSASGLKTHEAVSMGRSDGQFCRYSAVQTPDGRLMHYFCRSDLQPCRNSQFAIPAFVGNDTVEMKLPGTPTGDQYEYFAKLSGVECEKISAPTLHLMQEAGASKSAADDENEAGVLVSFIDRALPLEVIASSKGRRRKRAEISPITNSRAWHVRQSVFASRNHFLEAGTMSSRRAEGCPRRIVEDKRFLECVAKYATTLSGRGIFVSL